MFDAMTIRSNVFYVKWYDRIATKALIFMLVRMHGSRKYPIRYVLIDKISANNLFSLGFCILMGEVLLL